MARDRYERILRPTKLRRKNIGYKLLLVVVALLFTLGWWQSYELAGWGFALMLAMLFTLELIMGLKKNE